MWNEMTNDGAQTQLTSMDPAYRIWGGVVLPAVRFKGDRLAC